MCAGTRVAFALLLALAGVLTVDSQSVGASWAGVNSFFLHAIPNNGTASVPGLQAVYLDRMKAAGLKVLRIFISATPADYKKSGSHAVKDLETDHVGAPYDDTILGMIDDLMVETHSRGIKLDIAMHDRYALGCWSVDGYVTTYNLPNGCCKCDTTINQPSAFYVDPSIQQAFDNRLTHILNHPNPHFQNRSWSQLSEAILSFAPENEAQGHLNSIDWGWWCRRAQIIKKHVGTSGILVSTGGSIDMPTGLWPQLYFCPELDIVDLHTYSVDAAYIEQQMRIAATWAVHQGKRLRLQEFGVQSDDWTKSQALGPIMVGMNQMGVPFTPWELVKPANNKDFEFWTSRTTPTNGFMWTDLSKGAAAALTVAAPFSWPEIASSGPGTPKGDWLFCTINAECANGCCSVEQSTSDGRYKCTPGGTQCTGNLLSSGTLCTGDSDCANSCCSKQYSSRHECTDGGTPSQCGNAVHGNGQSCAVNADCMSGCCEASTCVAHGQPDQCSGAGGQRRLFTI
mmetsp:Transcript_138792/g.351813  ORF Transcript_138792/g.351813 Transcript_138792/m.351813 type:complete len:512 (+) Transcript_138792:77-1612(+)